MRRYGRDIVRALLELLCAVGGHAHECRLLNRGPLGRLYTWSMAPHVWDALEGHEAGMAEDFPSPIPEGMDTVCLTCERAFAGELLVCPRLNCPVLELPQC